MTAITAVDVMAFLNITDAGEQNAVTMFIAPAQQLVESMVDRTFASFYDDAAFANTVPEPLRLAAIQCAAAMYEDRDRFTIPAGVYQLMAPYRAWVF